MSTPDDSCSITALAKGATAEFSSDDDASEKIAGTSSRDLTARVALSSENSFGS